jgi:hypothetical protein
MNARFIMYAASVDDSKEMRQLSQYDHTQQQV